MPTIVYSWPFGSIEISGRVMASIFKVAILAFLMGMVLTTALVGLLNFRVWTAQSIRVSNSLRIEELNFFSLYYGERGVNKSSVSINTATTVETYEFKTAPKTAQAVHSIKPSKIVGPPISKPANCYKEHCTEHLQRNELLAMNKCLQGTSQRAKQEHYDSLIRDNDCNFMDGTHRRPVALASAEGSGNTWIRGLLERATGICTGFLYCDYEMRKDGFIGEGIKSGSVLVVKTHTGTTQWYGVKYAQPKRYEPYYGSAIFILRNPYDSLISEWNRRVTNAVMKKRHMPHNGSHVNVVPEDYWRKCCHKLNQQEKLTGMTFLQVVQNGTNSFTSTWTSGKQE